MSTFTIKLSQNFIFAILFSIFTTAYILSPYWIISPIKWQQYLFLGVSIGCGLLWAYLASHNLQIRLRQFNWLLFTLLFAGLFILNYRSLGAVIPWRGDEDFHISRVLELWQLLRLRGILIAVLFLLFLYEGWRKSRQLLLSSLFFVLLSALIIGYTDQSYEAIVRYPHLIKWLSIIFLYLTVPFVGLFQEAPFRIMPFLSTVLLAWLCQYKLSPYHKGLSLLFGIVVGTIPLIFYYTSLLYIEMPVVVLLTIVCFNINKLLTGKLCTLTKEPVWYALILIGFIKETTIPFLAIFVLYRLLLRFAPQLLSPKIQITDLKGCLKSVFSRSQTQFGNEKSRKIQITDLTDEAKVMFCTLFPLGLYLFYRNHFAVWRQFSPDFLNLLNLEVYAILVRAIWEQFGPIILLFMGGCFILALKKQYQLLIFLLLAFIAEATFHLIDDLDYIGYSRFNLFLVPPSLVGAYYFLVFLSEKNIKLTSLVLMGIITTNFVLLPLNRDGTKQPGWGNYRLDTSEHYYPYGEAISWLKENHHSDTIRFTGLYSRYLFEFYFQKFGWVPSYDVKYVQKGLDESLSLEKSLSKAKSENIQVVVYHVLADILPQIKETHGFIQQKVFTNEAHTLIIYSASH